MGYEDECAFVGPEVCEERLNEKGLNMADEESQFYEDFK